MRTTVAVTSPTFPNFEVRQRFGTRVKPSLEILQKRLLTCYVICSFKLKRNTCRNSGRKKRAKLDFSEGPSRSLQLTAYTAVTMDGTHRLSLHRILYNKKRGIFRYQTFVFISLMLNQVCRRTNRLVRYATISAFSRLS